MINLFGSPAGRAINKITSIKLNKSEEEETKDKTKVPNGANSINKDLLTNGIQLNVTNSISGCGSSIVAPVAFASQKKSNETYSNLHKKKVKCWKFIEDDKLNNNCTRAEPAPFGEPHSAESIT